MIENKSFYFFYKNNLKQSNQKQSRGPARAAIDVRISTNSVKITISFAGPSSCAVVAGGRQVQQAVGTAGGLGSGNGGEHSSTGLSK